MSNINSKENSMSTTFNPYAFVVSAALTNANKEIITMMVTPHRTTNITHMARIKAAGVLRHFTIVCSGTKP